MSKKKMSQFELESGIGEEIDLDAIEVEETDDEQFVGFAQEAEDDISDEELIAEYERCLAEECEDDNHEH